MPHYGPAPTMPGPPKRRNPLRLVVLALIALAVVALGALVITGLDSAADRAIPERRLRGAAAGSQPTALPLPETYEQADDWVTNNAFYDQTAPVPVRCNSQPINVTTASDAQLKAHFEGLMECLIRVWQPPVTAAGLQSSGPR